MTKKLFLLGLIAVGIILAGCSKDNPLEPQASSGTIIDESTSMGQSGIVAIAGQPIIGHFETVIETFIPIEFIEGQPVKFTMHIVGKGFVTRMGVCTVEFDQIGDYSVDPITLVANGVVITDRNGNKLYFDSEGTASNDPVHPTFSGTFSFTGGTGPYTGACGMAKFKGSADTSVMTGEFSFAGTIKYDCPV